MTDIAKLFKIPSPTEIKNRFYESAANTKTDIREILAMGAPLPRNQFNRLADFVKKFYNPEVVSARQGIGVDDKFSYGFTLATFAISKNHTNEEIFGLLHHAGADLHVEDGHGKTPYDWLINKGCFDEAMALEKLLEPTPNVSAMPPPKPDYAKALYIIDIAG